MKAASQRFSISAFQLFILSAFPLHAAPIPIGEVTVPAGTPATISVALPGGADLIRVTGDWSAESGAPTSNKFKAEILAPAGVSANAPFFNNATNSADPVSSLTASPSLTSRSSDGLHTFTFTNNSPGTTAQFDNITVELLRLLDSKTISGSIGPGSPTFLRPEEDGTPSTRTTRYHAATFTPEFSGLYSIATSYVGFDGFLVLYGGNQSEAPFSDFIAANDDSPGGEDSSRLEVALDAGETYTVVATSFSTVASGTFTNRIRIFNALIPDVGKATEFADYADQRGFVGGPEADDSGNGLANLLEYALGRDADSPLTAPLETLFRDGRLVGRFYRDPDLTDLTYILEATSNLADPASWEELYNSATDLQANADGDFQEIQDVEPVGGSRFFRLRVVLGDAKPTTYAAYSAQEGLGGPEADDNNNGLSNLLEYALGRTPESPYAAPLEVSFENNRLVGRFYRDPELSDIDYLLLASSDLSTPLESWEVLYDSSVDPQPNADGDFQEIEDSQELSGQRFFRLRIRQHE